MARPSIGTVVIAFAALSGASAQAATQNAPKKPWASISEVPAESARILKAPQFEPAWRDQVRTLLTVWSANAVTPSCPASEIEPSVARARIAGVISTAQFIQVRIETEICSEPRAVNFMIIAGPGGALGLRPLTPGHTAADPVLEQDTLPHVKSVVTSMTQAGRPWAGRLCTANPGAQAKIIDVQPVDYAEDKEKKQSTWRERWIYRACGADMPVMVAFTQRDGIPGTDIAAMDAPGG